MHFCLLSLAGLLPSRVCRAALPRELAIAQDLVVPLSLGGGYGRQAVCAVVCAVIGKGLIMMGSLTGNMGGPPRGLLGGGWKALPI